jgi:hypothetical protein
MYSEFLKHHAFMAKMLLVTSKLTDKITMRYVFQIFYGIQTIIVRNKDRFYYHIKDQAYEILKLLGPAYQTTYGV